MEGKRLSWDELFMSQAFVYAARSACLFYKVGVIFVKKDVVVAGGYNGPPRGEPNCCEVGCAKLDETSKRLPAGSGKCRGAHAEINAIINAASRNGGLENSRVYCTISPCYDCAKHLLGLPIIEFIYMEEYKEKEGQKAISLLQRKGVNLKKLTLERRIFNE